MSIRIQRSPGTARQIGEMLTKVNLIHGDVELVTIARRAAIGYADTGIVLEIDDDGTANTAHDLVSEVVKVCRDHAVELGDAWYQATFLSDEREVTSGTGKNKKTAMARASLAVCAFPIGDADVSDSPRTAAKAAIESEAAVAIRAISDFTSSTLTKLGDQVVQIAGAVKGLVDSQIEVARQIGNQQKGYITQGETLVELVRMNHAHQLAMAEAEASNKHADKLIDVAENFGIEWAKANLFNKPSSKGFKPDPNKPDSANIIGDVLHGLDDEKRGKLIELIGQDTFDLWVGASKASTDDEVRAIFMRVRDLWADKGPEEMEKISRGLPAILGADAVKLYAVFKDMGVAE